MLAVLLQEKGKIEHFTMQIPHLGATYNMLALYNNVLVDNKVAA